MRGSANVRDEGGFTLIEALVTMVMMLVVFFALHSVFEAGVRAVSIGRDETEVVGRARLGMERMERDLRAASPYGGNERAGDRHLFFDYETPSEPGMPADDEIAFGNDLDGECGLRKTGEGGVCRSVAERREIVSYYVGGSGALIRRNNNQRSPLVDDVSGLRFAYFDADGNPATTEDEIRRVDLSLTVAVGDAEQTLTSSVVPRSRAG